MKILSLLACGIILGCSSTPHTHEHDRHVAGQPNQQCTSWSDQISSKQQDVINKVMGDRIHRLQHALWHAARGGLNTKDQHSLVNTFGQAWAGARSLCPSPDASKDASYNSVGEDFLYMHRHMISMLQAELVANGLPCIKAWDHVPSVAEAAPPDSNRSGAKSDQALSRMKIWGETFKDRDWLKSRTLSEVGWSLENTLHNNLHMRFATETPPPGYKDGAPVTFTSIPPAEWAYNKPAYNWLADPYGAALNPTFWKIHGFVDSVIDAWLAANNYSEIAEDCGGKSSCYQWKGEWVGSIDVRTVASENDSAVPEHPDVTRAFTKARLRIQKLGVLTDADFETPKSDGAGVPRGIKFGNDNDPYQFAKQRVCNE